MTDEFVPFDDDTSYGSDEMPMDDQEAAYANTDEPPAATTALLVRVQEHISLTATSLTVHGLMSFDDYEARLNDLRDMEGSLQWWVGDLINWGEHAFGEKYAQAVDETEAETWRKYANIAARYPSGTRIPILSWSHHREVAYINEPHRSKLLQNAAELEWSVKELADAKNRLLNPPGDEEETKPPVVNEPTPVIENTPAGLGDYGAWDPDKGQAEVLFYIRDRDAYNRLIQEDGSLLQVSVNKL